MQHHPDLDELRAFHAKAMTVASGSSDERLERIFALVRREMFLGPGPWQIMINGRYMKTPSANLAYVYQNLLVALDAAKGINNGEPFLHAAWMGAVAPKPGERIVHVGAGSGYYTALLSMLVLPNGRVHAFEIDTNLARRAAENLRSFEGVSVVHGDATTMSLPTCDLIYVNAGVVCPPASWLKALRPGGRVIFPWRPTEDIGLTLLMTRTEGGFVVRPLMPSWFIPCIGASDLKSCTTAPRPHEARAIDRAWLVADRPPDDTAIAIYEDIWFSDATKKLETREL